MRILFVCADIPTRRHIRTLGLLSALVSRGHRVSLVCGATPEGERGAAELRERGINLIAVPQPAGERLWNMLRALPGPLPLPAAAARGEELIATLYREARSGAYDVAHLDGLSASGLAYALAGLPTVFDPARSASLALARRSRDGWRAGAQVALALARVRPHEATYLASYERVIAASDDDAWALRALTSGEDARSAGVHVIPTPVESARESGILSMREQHTLLLCPSQAGRADVIRRLIAEVLPRIWAERAEVRLLVSGPLPAPLARRSASDPRILSVSAIDARAIARATLALAPGDSQSADGALLAMGAGTPLIASPLVGRALRAENGAELLLADGPAALARAVLDLLDDPRYRGQIGRAGRAYVERHHRPEVVAAELERVYAAARGVDVAGWGLNVGLGSLLNRELGA